MASLYCILARKGNSGVIFRRGPSKQVRLISWNLAKQTFTPGQWLKGRIYVRKSDLSPDGTKLVYFAARHTGDLPTWVAVSTPPYLTAHVLWRTIGTYNHLSLFETNDQLALATYRADSSLQPELGFEVPRQLLVKHRPWPGYFYKLAEHDRLVRDGWSVSEGDPVYRGRLDRSVSYRKTVVGGPLPVNLVFSATGETDISYSIINAGGDIVDLKANWADAQGNHVYYSRGGKLFSIRFMDNGKHEPISELADFSDMTFEGIETPPQARGW